MFEVIITEPAEHDIRNAFEWWRDHRSADEAERWYENIVPAIATLREFPDRCPLSRETDLHPSGLRELHFGIGRRPISPHRVHHRKFNRRHPPRSPHGSTRFASR